MHPARDADNDLTHLPFPDPALDSLLAQICSVLPSTAKIYLVGGAVRDIFLSNTTHDYDFVLPADSIGIGRRVANLLGGAFYVLDAGRNICRVILQPAGEARTYLDFATLRGPDLETDLRWRDFTINAMAVDLRAPHLLIDPQQGLQDLFARELRPCADGAFLDDPVRVLRAIRLAASLNLHIAAPVLQLMNAARSHLSTVSAERIRDELFRILEGPNTRTALRLLDHLNVLPEVLPELPVLHGVTQSPPHQVDVWTHSLNVLSHLQRVIHTLTSEFDSEKENSFYLGLLSLRLGRYRPQIDLHMRNALSIERSHFSLLNFAALYHDSGKLLTRQVSAEGRIHFYNHEQVGAEMIAGSGQKFHLKNLEIDRLKTIVRHHMRPSLLAQAGEAPTQRAVYRFFRDTGSAGIDICLLSLADFLAIYDPGVPTDLWLHHLDVIRHLMAAWWEQKNTRITPAPVINGDELMAIFTLPAGPRIGSLLETIREAQATGQVNTREEALALVKKQLESE